MSQFHHHPPACDRNSHIQCVLGALDAGNVLAHNIECCSVPRRGYDDWQAALDSDASVKPDHLHRNLALVMEHGDNTIIATPVDKYGVRREWTLDIDTLGGSDFDAGPDGVDFLATEYAVLAVMRVESAYTYARTCNPEILPTQTSVLGGSCPLACCKATRSFWKAQMQFGTL